MAKTGSAHSSTNVIPELLHRLCTIYIKNQDKLSKIYKHCLNILSSNVTPTPVTNEFRLCQKVQKKLVVQHRESDALKFTELHRHIKTQGIIKNSIALVQFLMILNEEATKQTGNIQDSLLLDSMDLPAALIPSSMQSSSQPDKGTSSQPFVSHRSSTPQSLTGTSGISSWRSNESTLRDPSVNMSDVSLAKGHASSSHLTTPRDGLKPMRQGGPLEESEPLLPEHCLIQDLLYVFQGIDGKYITMKRSADGFRIIEEVVAHPSVIEHCHKLAELGWLYRKVSGYIETKKQDPSLGLVVQSFVAALSLELTEYYRLVAVLEAQLSSDYDQGQGPDSLTLRRLVVWTREPLEKLKTLAILVDGCKGLKGGALVSTLYKYAQHGDPEVKGLVKHILNQVYRPINTLLNAWIFEGQLQDQYNEFFIAADVRAPEEKLWHGKYYIRANMLPKFITEELAKKVLTVGKSINFLRQRCHDHTELFSVDEKTWFMNDGEDCSFDSMTGPPLTSIVNITYKETSHHLLHILNTQYHLGDHLKAFRKYLLLGQGDFIKHLMDIIEQELAKRATVCYVHNLTAILETAIRATNAQYDDQDVLNRLDVQMLDASPGDTGWDVFSLLYRVDGPISTVFTQDTMLRYLQVFNFLWRAKRIEFILAGLWRSHMTYRKQLRNIPEFHATLHQCQLITGALVHFISQLQYYIMFECLECSWADLLKRMQTAVDLDEVITAHSEFLDVIVTRCLLDPHSQPLLTQLRTLFDLIVDYQSKQETMFVAFIAENERRKDYELIKQNRADEGLWAETQEDTEREYQKREEFQQSIVVNYHSQFAVLEHSYNDTLKSFLERVSSHLDENLQFLARRLDFNRFYRGTETMSFSMT